MTLSPRAHRRGVAALFVLSGASGLVFEIIWVRQLGHWVGHSTVAVSLVVAAFLAGLVLGAWWGGARADRDPAPLRRYSLLELATGLGALAVSLALSQLPALLLSLSAPPPGWLRHALGFVLLLGPTSLMGATLPTLARHVVRDPQRAGRPFATLYAVNTLGAALGCGLGGFVLLGRYGLVRTAIAASLLNVLVAALAWALHRTTPPTAAHDAAHDTAATAHTDAQPSDRARLAALAATTGFAAIACEVLWFRVLHAFVRSSTYAFTLLLVVFLLGLVAGGAVYARRLADHPRPWRLLADVQALLAAAVTASVALLGRAGSLTAWLAPRLGGHADTDNDLLHALLGLVVVGLPAALMGVSFPLVAALGARSAGAAPTTRRGVGAAVGDLSALNTLGGALGSLAATLVLVPALGAQRSFFVAVALGLVAALVAGHRAEGATTLRGAAGQSLRAALAVLAMWAALPGTYLLQATTQFPRARVLALREGRDGTAAVLGYDRATVCRASRNGCRDRCTMDFAYQQLLFGTISYASTIPPARRYMRALAHLPMLHRAEAPSDVLEICFGTGTTAGAFLTHDTLRALTVVDINPDVFALARHFAESNLGVATHPRVRLLAEDGRHHLASTRDAYDVISLEPPPPTAEGAAALYTREFYALARRRLRAGGVLAQWIPLDQQTAALNRAMLAAVRAEFAYAALYVPARLEGVVLASDRPLDVDLAAWARRWASPAVRDNLGAVGFAEPAQLLATRMLDAEGVVRWMGDARPVTDDLPTVEFYRAWPGAPFGLDHLLPSAVDPARGLGLADAARVRRFVGPERDLMRSWDRHLRRDLPGARQAVARARDTLGATPYTDYLTHLEYDCLNLDDP